jgi:hypothetical protein
VADTLLEEVISDCWPVDVEGLPEEEGVPVGKSDVLAVLLSV